MTSATERLRALLDERGVEHYDGTATWYVDGVMYNAWGYDNERLTMSVCHLTPAQAIDATLGRGTCEWCADGKFDRQTVMMSNHGWQRINYCPSCGRRIVGG